MPEAGNARFSNGRLREGARGTGRRTHAASRCSDGAVSLTGLSPPDHRARVGFCGGTIGPRPSGHPRLGKAPKPALESSPRPVRHSGTPSARHMKLAARQTGRGAQRNETYEGEVREFFGDFISLLFLLPPSFCVRRGGCNPWCFLLRAASLRLALPRGADDAHPVIHPARPDTAPSWRSVLRRSSPPEPPPEAAFARPDANSTI